MQLKFGSFNGRWPLHQIYYVYRIQTIANKLAGNVVIFILHFALISFGIVYKAYFFGGIFMFID